MGLQVQKKSQKSFDKQTDAAVRDVSQPDLFDQAPETCARRFLADLNPGADLSVGDPVHLELQNGKVIGTRGRDHVLSDDNPPSDVVDHIRAQSGIAAARVSQINPLSATAEVDLC